MPDFCNSASKLVDFLQLGSLYSRGRGSETGSGIPTSWGIAMLDLKSSKTRYKDIFQQTHRFEKNRKNNFFFQISIVPKPKVKILHSERYVIGPF